MEIKEKRKANRIKASLPVTFSQTNDQKSFGRTSTRDISLTGMRINTDSFLTPDTSLIVKLHFPEVSRVIEAMARVVWSQRSPYSDQYQAGMEFSEVNPIFKRWLEEYILINTTLSR